MDSSDHLCVSWPLSMSCDSANNSGKPGRKENFVFETVKIEDVDISTCPIENYDARIQIASQFEEEEKTGLKLEDNREAMESFGTHFLTEYMTISETETVPNIELIPNAANPSLNPCLVNSRIDEQCCNTGDGPIDTDNTVASSTKSQNKTEAQENPVQSNTSKKFIFNRETISYQCTQFDQISKNKSISKIHENLSLKLKESVRVSNNMLFDMENGKLKCRECGGTFESEATIVSHQRLVCNKDPKYGCMFCAYKGRNPTLLRVHIWKKHEKMAQLNEDGTWSFRVFPPKH